MQTFGWTDDLQTPGPFVTQDSSGIPGILEAGDRYGASVSTGTVRCDEATMMAVGAPGEDLGPAADAGAVTISPAPDPDGSNLPCPGRILSQGDGLPGTAETGDATGETLAVVRGDLDQEEFMIDSLLIGAPGEDSEIIRDGENTGRAMVWSDGRSRDFGFLGGDREGLGYGSVLGPSR